MPTREARRGTSTASDWSTGHSLGLSLVRTETPGDIVTSNNVRVGREKERGKYRFMEYLLPPL